MIMRSIQKKITQEFTVFVCLCIAIFSTSNLFATHAAGGYLSYECTGGEEYIIQFHFFEDCHGGAQIPNQICCYLSSQSCGLTYD